MCKINVLLISITNIMFFSNHFNHKDTLVATEIERMLDTFWGSYHTRVTLKEHDDHYKGLVSVAGFDKSDIKLTIKDKKLSLTAVSKQFGSVGKIITLPVDADESSVNAKLKNGILSITINKKEESRGKDIKIS
tara:strand:- start:1633 stop:2034 length:402 start_codon:yes stop_codon:yes gene_type:complete